MVPNRLRKTLRPLKRYGRRLPELLTARRRHWHIVGDSHVEGFRAAAQGGLLARPALFTKVGGATAAGLRNPNSRTDAIGLFRRALSPFNRRKIPVIQLGEVDCGFVIWYRAQKYGEPVEDQLDLSVAAHLGLVDDLRRQGYGKVVLTAATLPTIRDGQDWGEVANARREVSASLRERTALTLRYNARLREAAESRGLPFIDLSDQILDPRTGLVADAFRHPDPKDHHLHPERIGRLWAAALNRLEI